MGLPGEKKGRGGGGGGGGEKTNGVSSAIIQRTLTKILKKVPTMFDMGEGGKRGSKPTKPTAPKTKAKKMP